MVDSSLFLEEVRKIARNQIKIETARKERIEKLQKDNARLREETENLKLKIRACEEKSKKRQATIKELRGMQENAKKGIFAGVSTPPKAVVSPDKYFDVQHRSDEPLQKGPEVKRIEQIQDAWNLPVAHKVDPTIAALARASTESRNRVPNPCFWARLGNCKYGSRCRASYCPAFNTSGLCEIPSCHLQHSLYRYEEGPTFTSPTNTGDRGNRDAGMYQHGVVDGAAPVRTCNAFQKGPCERGDLCKFTHVAEVCRKFLRGVCDRERCRLRHVREECHDFQRGVCTRGDSCLRLHVGSGPATVIGQDATQWAQVHSRAGNCTPPQDISGARWR